MVLWLPRSSYPPLSLGAYIKHISANGILAAFSKFFISPVGTAQYLPVLDDLLDPSFNFRAARISRGKLCFTQDAGFTKRLNASNFTGKLWALGATCRGAVW